MRRETKKTKEFVVDGENRGAVARQVGEPLTKTWDSQQCASPKRRPQQKGVVVKEQVMIIALEQESGLWV